MLMPYCKSHNVKIDFINILSITNKVCHMIFIITIYLGWKKVTKMEHRTDYVVVINQQDHQYEMAIFCAFFTFSKIYTHQ